jgi:asparagine synthase (glutamine-hydrolysing)
VRELHPDCVAFTIGTPDSDDVAYARRVARDLGVEHEVIELAPGDIRWRDIREASRMAELTEYGDVINAVISRLLFARVHAAGIKVVLCGDGSDELFGGYDMYRQPDVALRQRIFQHKLHNLGRTELQRVDRTSMGHGVETRVPFLDLALVRLAMRLPIELKLRDGQEKWILRHAFADILPEYVRQRPKNPLSHSCGLHERVRLYRSQFPRLYRSFGYPLLGPMRRDFSVVLEARGLDLDLALRDASSRPDYSLAEHARDLASALRWNAVGALKPRARRSAARSRLSGRDGAGEDAERRPQPDLLDHREDASVLNPLISGRPVVVGGDDGAIVDGLKPVAVDVPDLPLLGVDRPGNLTVGVEGDDLDGDVI